MQRNKAIMAGIGYSIGNILIRGISFISTPIFTRILSTSDFGTYSAFVSYESILAMVIGLCLHSSIKSANIEFPGKLSDYVSTMCILQVFLMIFSVSIWGITYFYGFDPLKIGILPTLLMIINGFASSVILVYNSYLSISYEYKKYLILSLLSSTGNIFISIILIYTLFIHQRYVGRVAGTTVTATIVASIILIMLFTKSRPRIDKSYVMFGVSYSLPIIPHGLSQVVLAQFGKIAVQQIVGNSEAGIFGLAFTIAMIPQVIGTSLDTAWSPWFFENFKKNRGLVKKRATQYLLIFSFIIIALTSFSAETVYIFADKPYWGAIYIVPSAVLSMYFLFLYYFPASIEYYEKKTRFIALGSIIAAGVNIILNFVCVKRFGYRAASYVTLVTYIFYFALHLLIAGKISKLPFNLAKMSWIVLITSLVAFLDIIFIKTIAPRIFIMVAAVLILYFLNKKEINEIVEILKLCD